MKKVIPFFLILFVLVGMLFAAAGSTMVFVSRFSDTYHLHTCPTIPESAKIRITLFEAVRRGYTPCRVCVPPLLDK